MLVYNLADNYRRSPYVSGVSPCGAELPYPFSQEFQHDFVSQLTHPKAREKTKEEKAAANRQETDALRNGATL